MGEKGLGESLAVYGLEGWALEGGEMLGVHGGPVLGPGEAGTADAGVAAGLHLKERRAWAVV